MVVDRGVGLVARHGLAQVLLGQLILAHLEVHPAQRVQIGAIHRLQFDGLADQLERLGQAQALVGQHVAQVVQGHGVGRVKIQGLAEELFGRLEVLLPLGQFALEEQKVDAVFLLGGQGTGLAESVLGVFPAAHADIHLAQRQPDGAVLAGVGDQPLGHRQALFALAQVGQFAGQHQLQFAILGVGLDGFVRNLHGLVELLGVAISVHLPLKAAQRHIAAQVDHLLIGGDGLGGLVLLVIDRPQPLQEDAAIVLLLGGIGAVGVGGQVHHFLVGLGGFVVAPQHVQQQPLVIARFKAGGVLLARLADGGQRIFVLSLAALDLADVDERPDVFRIGLGQLLILLERLVELVVAEQGLGQRGQRAHIARLHVRGALIGGDGVLGALQLLIGRAQGKLHLGRAVGDGDRLDDLGGMFHVAAIGVEPGQVENHFFRVGLDGLGDLELLFRLLVLVLDGVELAQDHAVLYLLGLQGDDLLELGDGLVQHVAGGRCRGDGVLPVAQLAQVNAPQQLVRLDVAGVVPDQLAGGGVGLARAPGAEVQIGQPNTQLRGAGIGVQRQLVLFDGAGHQLRTALGDGLFFVKAAQ